MNKLEKQLGDRIEHYRDLYQLSQTKGRTEEMDTYRRVIVNLAREFRREFDRPYVCVWKAKEENENRSQGI